jgi:cobyrinic acid a,c-diamide synthase
MSPHARESGGDRRAAAGAPLGFVIAGTHSGVGKTSLSLGLMGALRRSGHAVAPFKVGPDYIDPTYHTSICGRPSRNLDTWLMPPEEAVGVFARGVAALADAGTAGSVALAAGSDTRSTSGGDATPVAVVEGVMGLFDGRAGAGDACSTAEMAKLLDLPVILVVDCSHMARSAAAIVHGFSTFDPDLRVVGVILNKVAGATHGAMVREALAGGLPVVGVVPRRGDLQLDSRHLGLIPTVEDPAIAEVLERIVDHVEQHVDLQAVLSLAGPVAAGDVAGGAARVPGPSSSAPADRPAGAAPRRRVAVARDAAFSFYYQDNLEVLEEEGAEVCLFSPVAGDGLPPCDALYLGGGYPEVYAEELAANYALLQDVRAAAADGLPIYAECGGYLYLGREIEYGAGSYAMAGILPTTTTMAEKRLRIGYVEATPTGRNPVAGVGVASGSAVAPGLGVAPEARGAAAPTSPGFRGHLFHYSATTGSDAPAYRVTHKGETIDDGWTDGRIVASYVHLHFRGSRAVARWLAGGPQQGGEDR